jgi:hypothetical protein
MYRVVNLCVLKKAKRLKKELSELCAFLRGLCVKTFTYSLKSHKFPKLFSQISQMNARFARIFHSVIHFYSILLNAGGLLKVQFTK